MPVFNVADFGAIPDDGIDDTTAIQAALDAAFAAGGGEVILNAGTYDLTAGEEASDGSIRIQSNTTLTGAGMGLTTLRVMDGTSGDITGVIRTPGEVETHNVYIGGLTIDGNRANVTAKVDGFFCGVEPGLPLANENITIENVEVKNCSGYGFDPHEQTHNLTIRDCTSHDNTLDGFTLDYIVGAVVENCTAYNNGRHGFQIVTSSSDIMMTNNVAYDNGVNGIVVQRGSENGPLPDNITITGGSVSSSGAGGIVIRISTNVTISGVEVFENARSGIEMWGTDNCIIENNIIHDNSLSIPGDYNEIRVLGYNDPVTGMFDVALNNTIISNTIYSSLTAPTARYGIFEAADGTGNTVVANNDISGFLRAAVLLASPTSAVSGFDLAGTVAYGPVITGSIHNDTIIGTSASEFIYGGAGADTMKGDYGNDTYFIDDIGDKISEELNRGTDTVYSSIVTYSLSKYVENAVLLDTGVNLNGNEIDNILTGNALANSLKAGSGNDTVYGGGGNDNITGYNGNDVLFGEDGVDTLRGGNDNDRLNGGNGADKIYGDAGADTFVFDETALTGRDTIKDFNVVDGDRLELNNLLEGYDPLTDAISSFIRLSTSVSTEGVHTTYLRVDVNGTEGGSSYVQIARLDNVPSMGTVQDLVNAGVIVITETV